jgi:glutathione S-transferase
MWQWLCFEQYHIEPNIGTARFWLSLGKTRADLGDKLIDKKKSGYAAIDVLEQELQQRQFLVADRYSLADIAVFAFTHVAHEGGFDLEPYPNVRAWRDRVSLQPKWAAITQR